MNAIVFEHVPVSDLPAAWRSKLPQMASAQVRVRIEEDSPLVAFKTDDPAFGIWQDREETADVDGFVRKLREPRYGRDGARNAE